VRAVDMVKRKKPDNNDEAGPSGAPKMGMNKKELLATLKREREEAGRAEEEARKELLRAEREREESRRVLRRNADALGYIFMCMICFGEFLDTCVTTCGHSFCPGCWRKSQEPGCATEGTCPTCRGPAFGATAIPHARTLLGMARSCPNDGCPWTGTCEHYIVRHEAGCLYRSVQLKDYARETGVLDRKVCCPNLWTTYHGAENHLETCTHHHCQNMTNGCDFTGTSEAVDSHERNECVLHDCICKGRHCSGYGSFGVQYGDCPYELIRRKIRTLVVELSPLVPLITYPVSDVVRLFRNEIQSQTSEDGNPGPSNGGRTPSYSPARRSRSNSYCPGSPSYLRESDEDEDQGHS